MEADNHIAKMLTVTLDTSVLSHDLVKKLEQAVVGLPIHLVHTSVTEREMEDTDFTTPGPNILETGVYGESKWDQSVWGGESESHLLEDILFTLNPGYPCQGKRERLSHADRHHLRDAMILVTHVRSGADIFVIDEKKAFAYKRDKLEALSKTRIMNSSEFLEYTENLRKSR